MMPEIRITPDEVAPEDRFDRFRLIGWWDQQKLRRARILVIGAGALGNEILKNLALLGVGNIFVADLDNIENSNLSRSVLYRESDNGQPKATTAAQRVRDLYPQSMVQHFNGNIVYDLGLGVFRWADLTLGGLDNREARLAINRNCYRVNRSWIDGAIETVQGLVRVFVPDGPCYECIMTEMDWQLLQKRRSCNLLTREEMSVGGKTPTTPTISSIIAGVQCQEAVKYLHGLDTIAGHGWVFHGLSTDAYQVEYQRKEDCYSHEYLDEIIELDKGVDDISSVELLGIAKEHLGNDAVLELARDMLQKLVCPKCGQEEDVFASLGKVKATAAICPHCPETRREVVTFYSIRGDESFVGKSLGEIGVPKFDIVMARNGERLVGFELTADAPEVLGPLADTASGLEIT